MFNLSFSRFLALHSNGKKISHLFYMDDLKTFAENNNQQGLLQTVKTYSDDICMPFELDKLISIWVWTIWKVENEIADDNNFSYAC